MTDYLSIPEAVDRASVAADIYDRLGELIPGLDLQPNHPMTRMVEAFVDFIAELMERGVEVGDSIFRRLGTWLFRYPAREATQATGISTWTFQTNSAYTILAGTPVSLLASDGSRVGFLVRADVLKPSGSFSTGIGEVELIAAVPGANGTGLEDSPQLEQPLSDIDTITVEAPTIGGEDAEGDDEYLTRLRDYLGNRSDTLVTPLNFEVDARISTAQVSRAMALNGYDPGAGTFGNQAHITVAVVDDAGLDPGSSIRTAGAARQQGMAVAGLTVHWIGPTYTTLTIVFTGVAETGWSTSDVHDRAVAAVQDYISPANWGLPGSGDRRSWLDKPVVRFQDISTVLNNVEGFDHWSTLTINGGTADVTLTGVAALPAPAPTSTVTGTVT